MIHSQAQIHEDLQGILSNFQGRQYTNDIALETLIFGELGLVSIDAVVLGETLETFYDAAIPFHEFLAQLRDEQAEDISVGRLVEFLDGVLNK
jgi:acyl carrier protein